MIDPELEQWSELFRSEPAEPAEIVARAQQAVRRFRLWIYAEVAVTLLVGGSAIIWAATGHHTAILLLTAVAIIAAWSFRFLNDWNDFTGVATATGSYLNRLLRRLRSNLRAAEFGAVLYSVLYPLMYAWGFKAQGSMTIHNYAMLPANIVFALATIAFYSWFIRYRRKLENEIAELQKLQAELGDEPNNPPLDGSVVIARAIEGFRNRLKRKVRI